MRSQVAQSRQDTSLEPSQDEIQKCIIADKLSCFCGDAAGALKHMTKRRMLWV
jgi:hypothetical protein